MLGQLDLGEPEPAELLGQQAREVELLGRARIAVGLAGRLRVDPGVADEAFEDVVGEFRCERRSVRLLGHRRRSLRQRAGAQMRRAPT